MIAQNAKGSDVTSTDIIIKVLNLKNSEKKRKKFENFDLYILQNKRQESDHSEILQKF